LGGPRGGGDREGGVGAPGLEPADRLARLPHRLGRHRAGVDHDRLGEAGRLRLPPDHLRLAGVEPATEGDDIDAHAAPALANNAGSKRPSYSKATGPVISTWSSRSRHSIVRSPPGSVTVTLRPVRRSRAAAPAAAQAAEPPAPLSPP